MLANVTAKLAEMGDAVVAKTGQRQEEIKKLLESLAQPKDPPEQVRPVVYSQPGETYRLGHHTITAGAHGLEEVDKIRQDFAASQGQRDEWLTYCGPIAAWQTTPTPTQPETPHNATITPTI
jgi:hypothetical protein